MLLRSYTSEDLRDSTVALGFFTLALLDGQGDFAASLLIASTLRLEHGHGVRRGWRRVGSEAR